MNRPRCWRDLPGDIGRLVFRRRDVLAPVTLLLVVAASRHAPDFVASSGLDHLLDGVGTVAIAVGLGIRFLVVAGSGIRRSGVRKNIVAPTLYETGPYAWCRNPLYLANATMLIGLTLLFDSRWMVFVALPSALLAIRSIVATEERVLADSFGDRYRRYCEHVPRFVPRDASTLWSVRSLDWRRALRKEHGTAFAAFTTAVVLRAIEDHIRSGTAWRELDPGLPCAWLVAASLWTTARLLKHTGRLDGRSTTPTRQQPAEPPPPATSPISAAAMPARDVAV